MALFSFMDGPTVDAFSPGEFLQSAFDQPFSRSETFGRSAIGGVLDSFGLGTVIKDTTIDQGRRMVAGLGDDQASQDMGLWAGAPALRPETDAEIAARGDQALSESQYKSSPYFRAKIPWDSRMTTARAQALAQYDDARSVRDEIARRRPWTAMAGTFAGGALDPINYVPVVGEAAIGGAAARFGAISGRALIGAVDAAANTGIAGLLTAPNRRVYGDDVSWQAQTSQIAMAAALGAGFGAIGGAFRGRTDARAAALRADMESRMATVRAGQDAMATLQDAVAGLANDGEVRLGGASFDRLDVLHGNMANAAPGIEARVAETPAVYANRVISETMPEDVRRLSELDTAISSNQGELDNLRAEGMDNERFGPTRAAFIEARQLDAKYQRLADAAEKANSDKQRAQLQKQMADVQTKVQAIFDRLDPETVNRLEELERTIPLREQALADAKAAREPVAGKIDAARQEIQAKYLNDPAQSVLRPLENFDRTPDTEALAKNLETPTAQWAPESKARNVAGELVPVYHGTFSRFEKFDSEKLGKETEAGSAKEGFFFTENKDVASGYAKDDIYDSIPLFRTLNKLTLGGYKKLNEAILKMFGKSGITEGRVVTAHLDAKNPLIVEYGGREINEKEVADILRKAKAEGHDAVQFKQISDPGYTDASAAVADNWVVFSPDQIKIVDHGDPSLNAKMEAEQIAQSTAPRAGMKEPPPLPATPAAKPSPAPRAPKEIVSAGPTPEPLPKEPITAAKDVGKPDAPKQVAEKHGVDAETGDIPEQFELDQVAKEGRLTAEDEAAMRVANDNFETAKSWGEALRAAMACII